MTVQRGVWFDDVTTGARLTVCETQVDGYIALQMTERDPQIGFVLTKEQAADLARYLLGVVSPPAAAASWAQIEGRTRRCTCRPLALPAFARERDPACPVHGAGRPGQGGVSMADIERTIGAQFVGEIKEPSFEWTPAKAAEVVDAALVVCRELVLDTEPNLYDAVHDLATALGRAGVQVPHLPGEGAGREAFAAKLDALADANGRTKLDGAAYAHAAAMVRGDQDENGDPL